MGKAVSEIYISISDLYYAYGDDTQPVLKGISGDIYKGEMLAIIGANGSGKSTLIRHFNGMITPSFGSVRVAGMDTSNKENTWEIRRQVGLVFQNPDNQILAPVVEDDIAFGPENLGLESEEIKSRVAESLALVGLDQLTNRMTHTLSGGQKQLLAIAGVLAMHPQCLILDEPTAMLDPQSRRRILDLLIKLNHEHGITVVLVTHFMEEATLADRIWVIGKGNVVLQGKADEVFQSSNKLEDYGLELPPVRKLVDLLHERGLCLPGGRSIYNMDKLISCLITVLNSKE